MKVANVKNICFTSVLLIILLTMPFQASAEDPFMVKDLSLDQNFNYGVGETEFANVNGVLFFAANSVAHGGELWKYEGGSASLVKDIRPGSDWGQPSELTNVNGTLYFVATDGINGKELWKSDGTEAGTVMVKDINPGSGDSTIIQITDVNGTLYCKANDGTHGWELWKSDGTEAGTVMVKDIYPGTNSGLWKILIDVNGILYLSAGDFATGYELWKSDGTEAGTVLVKDIMAGVNHSYPAGVSSSPQIVNINGTLYFNAQIQYGGNPPGAELWKSDGTEIGTMMVKDINPGPLSSSPHDLTNLNGTLYFLASVGGIIGDRLWKSDGTDAGTVIVTDGFLHPKYLSNSNGSLYFVARSSDSLGTVEYEVWLSDGTAEGTQMLKNIRKDDTDSSWDQDLIFTDINGTLFFLIDDGINGIEVWKTDGTEAGTVIVKDIIPGIDSSTPANLIAVNNTLFFRANDGIHGPELWKSDGSEGGTIMAEDTATVTVSSDFESLTDVAGTLYFCVDDVINGNELWKSDGC